MKSHEMFREILARYEAATNLDHLKVAKIHCHRAHAMAYASKLGDDDAVKDWAGWERKNPAHPAVSIPTQTYEA